MHVTVNIPDELARHAQEQNISVEAYVERLLAAELALCTPRLFQPESGQYTPGQAEMRIRELRNSHHLNGMKIRDLINEGRRF